MHQSLIPLAHWSPAERGIESESKEQPGFGLRRNDDRCRSSHTYAKALVVTESEFTRFRTTGRDAARYRSREGTRLETLWAFPTTCFLLSPFSKYQPLIDRQPFSPGQNARLPEGVRVHLASLSSFANPMKSYARKSYNMDSLSEFSTVFHVITS